MTRYAQNTTVSADKSRAEIERTLRRYGASQFAYGWQEKAAMIGFEANGRRIRFIVPLPQEEDVSETPSGRRRRNPDAALEQTTRQRWRALALGVLAKLEMVESGIASFEEEFLPYTVLPNGKTVGEWLLPQVEQAYQSGAMPPLLLMPGDKANQ